MADNMFSDLIPRDAPKPKKVAGSNMFADLMPRPVQHAPGVTGQRGDTAEMEGEQEANIARKGSKAPGSNVYPDPMLARGDAVLLNWGNEVGAGITAPIEMLMQKLTGEAGPVGLQENYDQQKALLDASLAAARKFRPIESGAEEIAGTVATMAMPAKRVLEGVNLVRKVARGVAAGGIVGGIAGAGEGKGTQDRLEKGAKGAQVGALIGGGIPVGASAIGQGVRLVKAVGRAATAPVRSLADAEGFAASKAMEALKRDRLPPQRAEVVLNLKQRVKPDTILADIGGKNTDSLLRAAANVPSPARDKLTRDLNKRQGGQLERLRADVGAALGDPKAFTGTVETLALTRKANAKPLYDRAFATGTPWSVPLQNILQRPIMREFVGRAERAAANKGEVFKGIFAQQMPNGRYKFSRVPGTEDLHRIKLEIDKAITGLKNRSETSLGNVDIRDLTMLKHEYLNAIQNPAYKKALNQFAGDSALMNAIDDGFENALTMEPEAIVKTLKGLSQTEADLWRMGFARRVVNQLRDAGRTGTNRADILSSPRYLDRLRAAFKDDKSGKDFLRALSMENRQYAVRNAVQGNSSTAAQLAEGMEGGVEADNIREAADIGMKLARGNFVDAAVSWLGRAKNYATGLRPEVADEIIKLFTSRDPAKIKRAQRLMEIEIQKLTKRQGTAGRVGQGVNAAGFMALPSYVSSGGQ